MIEITTILRTSLDDLDTIVDNHRDELNVQISPIKADFFDYKRGYGTTNQSLIP